jgi:hypothetical protein
VLYARRFVSGTGRGGKWVSCIWKQLNQMEERRRQAQAHKCREDREEAIWKLHFNEVTANQRRDTNPLPIASAGNECSIKPYRSHKKRFNIVSSTELFTSRSSPHPPARLHQQIHKFRVRSACNQIHSSCGCAVATREQAKMDWKEERTMAASELWCRAAMFNEYKGNLAIYNTLKKYALLNPPPPLPLETRRLLV